MKKSQKYPGVANPRYAREMHELRSSGAAGEHGDKRTKRRRSRSAQNQWAIRDSMASWKNRSDSNVTI